MKYRSVVTASIVALALLTACSGNVPEVLDPQKTDRIDKDAYLSRDDYRHMARPLPADELPLPKAAKGDPTIPDLASVLAAPRPPKIGETQLVSIAVTDDVPLKDVLIELSRLADVDVELDAGITGGISFRAKEKPFNEVIDRIANLAGLRYTMKNNVLRVERDTPFIQNYSLDFLNQVRSSDNSVNISTNVLSSSGSGGGGSSGGSGGGSSGGGSSSSGGLNSGSSASIKTSAEGDFWRGFENGIKDILNYAPTSRLSANNFSAEADPVAPVGAPVTVPAPTGTGGAVPGGAATTGAAGTPGVATPGAGTAAAVAAAANNPSIAPGVPAVVAPVQAIQSPAPGTSAGVTGTGVGGATGANNLPFYIINKQAGVLTVSASQQQHDLIKLFIEKTTRNSSAQVLLEAKIVEVTLSDQFASGIDWSLLSKDKRGISIQTLPNISPGSALLSNFLSANSRADLLGSDLTSAVTLAEQFGTTRTLSSPRLHATNNQQAVLTFARNQVFFDISVDRQTNTGSTGLFTDNTTVDSEIRTVPIGIILNMQPSISTETNEVTLNVRPTLSRVVDTVNDPAVSYLASTAPAGSALSTLTNAIPIVETRELDSILKLKSGQVMVIGGLMEGVGANTDAGVPVASEIPIFGNLFKSKTKNNSTKELIIFIKATIVGTDGMVPEADKNIYQKFSQDPRPIAF